MNFFLVGKKMLHIQASTHDCQNAEQKDRAQSEGLPGGWWILPSAVLGLAGWVSIFFAIGLL